MRYFNGLRSRLDNPRIHPVVVERAESSESSPEHVLSTLDGFAQEYLLQEGDQLWLVIDRDSRSWKPRMFAQVARECHRKNYRLAASNPCFELWLLLHFEDIGGQSSSRKRDLFHNKSRLLKHEVASKMRPNVAHIDHFFDLTATAIERAQKLDERPRERWPTALVLVSTVSSTSSTGGHPESHRERVSRHQPGRHQDGHDRPARAEPNAPGRVG